MGEHTNPERFKRSYLGKNSLLVVIDMEALLDLSEEDFTEYYLKLMREYKVETRPRICDYHQCVINKSENLRRYNGRSFCAECFPVWYKAQAKNDSTTVRDWYFERVARLQLGLSDPQLPLL